MIYLLTTTFILSTLFIYLLIKYSQELGLQDIPNARSAHKRVIPKSAGLGFIGAVLVSLAVFDFSHLLQYYYIYISIFAVTLLGFYDDKHNVSHRFKFLVLLLIAIFICYHGVRINSIGTYFGYSFLMPTVLASIFTVIAIVGFTNALNLMDGLDGLAAGLSLVMFITFFALGYAHDDTLIMVLSSTFIVSLSAFLLFNWHPARIFMGDSGSLSLGFAISILSIKALAYMSPSSILFIIALPLIDTFIVMRRRIQRGQSPFKADKNHIHHFMYKTKLNIQFSVILLIYIQIALSIIGFQLRQENQILSLLLFFLLMHIFLNLFDQRFRYRSKKTKIKKPSNS